MEVDNMSDYKLKIIELIKSDMKKNVSYWAEKVGMIEHLNHRQKDLSGGQKKSV